MKKLERARYTARYHYDDSEGAAGKYKASETMNESDAFEVLDREIDRLKGLIESWKKIPNLNDHAKEFGLFVQTGDDFLSLARRLMKRLGYHTV